MRELVERQLLVVVPIQTLEHLAHAAVLVERELREAFPRLVRDALVLGVDHEGLSRFFPFYHFELVALVGCYLLGVP